ncbi:hypothetical protein [Amycolatopsis sp. NPDC059657]|uniref:hypothetical protein n=1 Tax=Amycolatopsis sp. NPDC059657 TaxID=3346899 RepID=UPI00366DFA22
MKSDLGITGLVASIPATWQRHGDPLNVVASAMPDDPAVVLAVRTDAMLLRDGLSSAEIESLWMSTVPATFLPIVTKDDTSWTQWMHDVVERCDQWLADHNAPHIEFPAPTEELTTRVAKEITEAVPGDETETALLRCATACSPDLAFRFLLKILRSSWYEVSGEQYDRLALLGQELDYAETVMSEVGELVRERQPVTFTDFDFGITGLASQFHQDWSHVGGPMDVVEVGMHPGGDRSGVVALRNDVILLRDGLSSAEIENLWNASCYGFKLGDPAIGVPTGTRWMELIAERCGRRLVEHDALEVEVPGPGHQLASAVEAEVIEVLPADDVRAALIRCVRQCSPDLAFRLLLRIINQRGCVLSTAQYERYIRLGEEFGYGEFVVSDIEYLAK